MQTLQSYAPFRYGMRETGRATRACPTCGTKPGNEHSLRTSGWCDRLRQGQSLSREQASQMQRVLRRRAA